MTAENLLIIRRVEIIDKREFVVVAPNADSKIFVVHVMALIKPTTMPIYSSYQVQVAVLISQETGIPTEYSDFFEVFSSDSMAQLAKYTRINNHSIDLLDDKQPLYGTIYSLEPVELEMLKTYIKANLVSRLIRPFKSSFGALILFVQKNDGSLRLCIDYRGLNNLTIKNCYSLPLINESLDCLGYAKRFT